MVDFVDRLDTRLETMEALLVEDRYEELSNEAHWLKGAGGTVGFGQFTEPAIGLMKASRESDKKASTHFLKAVVAVRARIVVPESATP